MGSSIAFGQALQGTVEGIDRGMARRDVAKQRERTDTQWEQGQEDRSYQLGRRGVEDQREDEQYNIAKEKQDRFKAGADATREWMATGKLDKVNEYMNQYTADGVDYDIQKSPDGEYISTMTFEGKKTEPKVISEDEIGQHMQMIMAQDPFAALAEQNKMKRSAEAAGAERKHDMAKLEREYQLKRGLKATPEGGKGKGADAKANLAWQKELNDLSKEDYGTLFGDQWKFDTTKEKTLRAAQAALSSSYYMMMDEPDTNKAHRQSLAKMRQFSADAQTQADAELNTGQIDQKDYDNRVADIIDYATTAEINELAPKPGETLQRGAGGGAGGAPEKTDANTDVPQEAIDELKADSSKANKEYFDQIFGEGSAARVLGEESGEDKALSKATDEAEAEPENPDDAPTLAREPKKDKKDFREFKSMSTENQKKRKQKAVTEFKKDWGNLSDDDKLKWWEVNSSALKAASPRSHRKGNKDVKAIRNKPATKKKVEKLDRRYVNP